MNKYDLMKFVNEIDLDSDSYVSENDLQNFLIKHKYLEQSFLKPLFTSTRNICAATMHSPSVKEEVENKASD
jgi:hypothetical protein